MLSILDKMEKNYEKVFLYLNKVYKTNNIVSEVWIKVNIPLLHSLCITRESPLLKNMNRLQEVDR